MFNLRFKFSLFHGNALLTVCLVAVLLVGILASIVPQAVDLFWGGSNSDSTEATLPTDVEFQASQWIKENTSSSAVILSDPVSMDIISSLSERISLAQFSMGNPVREPEDTTRVALVLQLFESNTSLNIYDCLSQLSQIGVSGDEFYRSFEPLETPSFLMLMSSRTVAWIESGGQNVITYLDQKPIPDSYISKFESNLFDIVFSINQFLYIVKPKYSQMLSVAESLGSTGSVAYESLLLDLPLNEGTGSVVHDQLHTDNAGTVFEPRWTTNSEGEYELNFNGYETYVSFPQLANQNFESFSISAWVKVAKSTLNEQTIVFQPDQYLLRIDSASEGGSFSFFVKDENGWEPRAKSGIVPNVDVWYHVVGVCAQTKIEIYVNGELMKNSPREVTLQTSSESILVGKSWCFNGVIKDVQIYGSALEYSDVQNLFLKTKKGYSILYYGADHDPGILLSACTTFQSASAEVYMSAKIFDNKLGDAQTGNDAAFAFQVYDDEQIENLLYETTWLITDIQNTTDSSIILLGTMNNLNPNAVYTLRVVVLTKNYNILLRNILIKEFPD